MTPNELLEQMLTDAEDVDDAPEDDELYEALALGLKTGRLAAVCPKCGVVLSSHYPGSRSVCGNDLIEPEDVIYQVRDPS